MTPGRRDPRPSGFGPMTWLWWQVVMAGWSLAATVMGAEAIASGAEKAPGGPVPPREGPVKGHQGVAGRSRTFRAAPATLGPLAAFLALGGWL